MISPMKSILGRLRDMRPYKVAATSIAHVAMHPEVQHALAKWIQAKTGHFAPGVLIGGLAMSFYAKPRMTEDVDLLFLSAEDIPEEDKVPGFKRYRNGAFREEKTHVDIEVITPDSFVDLPKAIAAKVTRTAVNHGDILVASLEGMIALKLCGALTQKRYFKDMADIVSLLANEPKVTMHNWGLSSKQLEMLEIARSSLES